MKSDSNNKKNPKDGDRPETLSQSAVTSVIRHIQKYELRVGEKLPSEAHFIEQLGVSRTVVREAFKSLSAIGIIEMSAGSRAQVGAFDDSVIGLILSHALRTEQLKVQQIWDARRAIEIRTVELAAMHRNEKEARNINALAQQMRENYHDLPVMTECDIAFHTAIAQAARNPLLPVLVASLTGAMRETNPIVWRSRKSDEEQLEIIILHEEIATAIEDGDPEAAILALERHFDVASSGLVKAGFN